MGNFTRNKSGKAVNNSSTKKKLIKTDIWKDHMSKIFKFITNKITSL